MKVRRTVAGPRKVVDQEKTTPDQSPEARKIQHLLLREKKGTRRKIAGIPR